MKSLSKIFSVLGFLMLLLPVTSAKADNTMASRDGDVQRVRNFDDSSEGSSGSYSCECRDLARQYRPADCHQKIRNRQARQAELLCVLHNAILKNEVISVCDLDPQGDFDRQVSILLDMVCNFK